MEPSANIIRKRTAAHKDRETFIRIIGFILIAALPVAAAWNLLRSLTVLFFENDTYSHIPLIPILSLFLIYVERRSIFSKVSSGLRLGSVLFLLGGMIFVAGLLNQPVMSSGNLLSILMLGLFFLWTGIFALFFGSEALYAARFPLLFLFFMVPIPQPLLAAVILLLQKGSAQTAAMLFKLFGVPVFQQGFDFTLPGVTIRVAEECSGIRSSLALLITAVLASHVFLRSAWGKLIFCILTLPIAVVKNGVRIVTLSTLAVYVDPSFLHGKLHHRGGVVFFLLGLLLLAFVLTLVRRSESRIKMLAQRLPNAAARPEV